MKSLVKKDSDIIKAANENMHNQRSANNLRSVNEQRFWTRV